jgi:RNA polymerase sigma factor (sigma-70 family)
MAVVGSPRSSTPATHDAALEDLVRQYLPVVYAAAKRQLPDPALAEDVAQAVFMVLARRRSELPANVVMSSWLLKVTHLACLQARRNAGRRIGHERRAAQMRSATTPAETITNGQLAAELDAALARLVEADRSVLTLRYLEQKSIAEVAVHLGISEPAAQKRIGRAMTRLREKLGMSEEQLGTASLAAFFLSQVQTSVPAHVAAQVAHSMAAAGVGGGAAGISKTAAALISKGVLKTLFWSSAKVPLGIAAAALALAATVYVVDQGLARSSDTPATDPVSMATSVRDMTPRAASSNVRGAAYPKVDGLRRATLRIYAPRATKVIVDLGEKYAMIKGDDGYWTGTTDPLEPGFHYYQVFIDGAAVPDPGSETFFGVSKTMSGLEVPDEETEFADVKDVPHGEIRARYYNSVMTNSTRQVYVYTPPSYDAQPHSRYPVVYLLRGVGEDQRAWVEQGHVGAILDNVIAQGNVREMIAVIVDSGTAGGLAERDGGRGPRGGVRGGAGPSFTQLLLNETIPLIDGAYRTVPDREHRALAGASYGGTQGLQIAQDHLDVFAYVGSFGAPFGYPAVPAGFRGLLSNPGEFARQVKVLYISAGAAENNTGARVFHQQMEGAGVPHVYCEFPGTAGGWQSWRKGLGGMAPLLFKN